MQTFIASSTRAGAWPSGLPRNTSSPRRYQRSLDRLTTMSSVGALGLGAAQGVLVIKNVPLAVGAGAAIGGAGLGGGETVAVLVLFALLATGGVIVPLAKASPGLTEVRRWLEANLTGVTVAILVLLGAVFVGNGLSILD